MKKKLVFVLVLVFVAAPLVSAQDERRLSAMPKAFQAFYAKFRKAVVKGDRKTVVAMTKFPFEYAFDAGDEGTFTKSRFTARYRDVLGGTRSIFKQRNPLFYVESGRVDLTDPDDASHYGFMKKGATYVFVSYASEP